MGLPFSRSQLRRRIDEGEVHVDGAPAKAAQKLRPGQRVRFTPPPPRGVSDLPEAIPLSILYEDAHLIVLDKPAGLVVHPAPGHETGTLVNALLHHCGALPRQPPRPDAAGTTDTDAADDDEALAAAPAALSIGGERRPGIVHRLDQGTSGVLVCAKDERTLVGLQAQFQAHTITRRYLALAQGELPDRGSFRTQYGRHPQDRKRFTGRCGQRHAVTHYRLLERLPSASLVELHLETGRTHQIRVHLSEAGHPLLGDPLYGKAPRTTLLRAVCRGLDRQALHASVLGFVHPATGAYLERSAPPPPDFDAVLRRLREGALES